MSVGTQNKNYRLNADCNKAHSQSEKKIKLCYFKIGEQETGSEFWKSCKWWSCYFFRKQTLSFRPPGPKCLQRRCVLKSLKERTRQVVEWVSTNRGGRARRAGVRPSTSPSPRPSSLFQVDPTCENRALLGELVLFHLSCVFVCLYSASFHLVIERIYGSQDPRMCESQTPEEAKLRGYGEKSKLSEVSLVI